MRHTIRTAALGASLLSLLVGLTASPPVRAEDYPSRTIKILQGYAPGGNADAVSRIIGKELSDQMKRTVLVESHPGAGGNLASEQVAHGAADGYTLVLLTTAHVISPAIYKSLPFDPINDFTLIGNVADVPYVFVVNAESPYKTLKELADAARAKPGTITIGNAGVGTGQHLCAELFADAIKAKFVNVPFRGDAAAVGGLLTRSVDVVVAPGTAIRGNIEAGKFHALAISSPKRWKDLPNVATVAETGVVPGFDVVGFLALGTAKGVPEPIVAKISKELKIALAKPEADHRISALGLITDYSTPKEFKAKVVSEIARWKDIAEKANIPKR
jgi:tripartite-type tricarboxylate transporter receptor subunit TctC